MIVRATSIALFLCALSAPTLPAAILRIDFAGTVSNGSVRGILFDQTGFTIAFTPGTPISGTVYLNLALAPTPTVTTDVSGTSSNILTTGEPVWMSGIVNLDMPALPPSALPIPSTFDLSRRVPPPGATLFGTQQLQQNLFYFFGPSIASVLLGDLATDSWSTSSEIVTRNFLLGLLVTDLSNFFPQVPGVQEFNAPPSVGGSAFQYLGYEADATNLTPPNFGISENYVVNAFFTTTSATGTFVAPEPATWMLAAPALLLLGFRRRR